MDLLRASLEPINLPFTILLVVVLAYWLMVILGTLDLSLFDVDLEVEADVNPGIFHALLAFINIGKLPLMFVLSVLIVSMWGISVLGNYYLDNSSALLALALFVPNLLVSLVITKVVTKPFSFVIGQLEKQPPQVQVIGSLCFLQGDASEDRFAQAEVETGGAPLNLLVRTRSGQSLAKGMKALVVEKEPDRDVYLVEAFDDWD